MVDIWGDDTVKVTVIGGTGFIGGATVDHLLKQGHTIYLYAKKKVTVTHSRCCIVQGDLQNDADLSYLMSLSDTVIYLVTATTPQSSMNIVESTYTEDIPLFLRVMESGYRHGVRRFIYASSGGAIYGQSLTARSEDDITCPQSHYGIGKLTCEKILELYNITYGMENIILRIANPFGVGQLNAKNQGVIVTFVKLKYQGIPLQIYGCDDVKKDYISVSYVADAFEKAMFWKMERSIQPVFNIGSGQGITLGEIVQMIGEVFGTTTDVKYMPIRTGDVSNNLLNIVKACDILGYIPPDNTCKELLDFIVTVREIIGETK